MNRCSIVFEDHRSIFKVTGVRNLAIFSPILAFPGDNPNINKAMVIKRYRKLLLISKSSPIVFEDHRSIN